MQAFRTRAAGAVLRARPTTLRSSRSYASGGHGHDHHHTTHNVEEGMGTAFYMFAGALPVGIFIYQITRPGLNGEPTALTKWLNKFDYLNDDWARRNDRRSELLEQAAHDKHLFYYSGRNGHVELKTPELFNSGSPWNVPAGHNINLDHITEHYRKQAAAEEERKAKKLAAAQASS